VYSTGIQTSASIIDMRMPPFAPTHDSLLCIQRVVSYWDKRDPTDDGVLGDGYGYLSEIDLRDSQRLLEMVIKCCPETLEFDPLSHGILPPICCDKWLTLGIDDDLKILLFQALNTQLEAKASGARQLVALGKLNKAVRT